MLGIGAAALLTVALGFSITSVARSNLLAARAELIAAEVAALPVLSVEDRAGSAAFAAFGTEVEHELLGGETERVKVWSGDGRILYSDDANLVGDRFGLSEAALAAFDGRVATEISDLEDPAHAGDRAAGQLIEVYVPVWDGGRVLTVVEVEQRLDSLNEAMGRIRRSVWLSIAFGIGVLAVFLSLLAVSLARRAVHRQQHAERVLGAAFRAQEEERRRIVGALHDDVGQPLYRLLYGLEGSRAKLPEDDPVAGELQRLEELVRAVDGTLRGELRQLHQGLAADAGLVTAVRDIAATTEKESGLHVHVDAPGEPSGLSAVSRTALFRALQEAVVNVRKHAQAENVWIHLESRPGRVGVIVEDDGNGRRVEPKLGLTTTRDRIEALGGEVAIAKRRRGGTTFTAWLPVEEDTS